MVKIPDFKNLLFIDIETVSCVPSFQHLDDRLKTLWMKKAGLIKNDGLESPDDLFFQKAGIYAEFGKVVTIALGHISKNKEGEETLRVKALYNHNEAGLLTAFKQLLEEKFDGKSVVFCAHNGKEFDFPYLCRRMLVNGICLPDCLDLNGKKPWEVNHIDTLELWKFGDRKNYTSLETLAAIFGIESSKNDIDGSQVNQEYYINGNLEKIAYYCMNDVVVTAQLFRKFCLMPCISKANIYTLLS
jgi:3'-5' exonuclease